MQRRGGVWWFRMRLPKGLAGLPAPAHVRAAFHELVNAGTGRFKREITVSLRTADRREAAQRNGRKMAQVLAATDGAISLLKADPQTVRTSAGLPSPEELEDAIFASILAEDDAEREAVDERLEDDEWAAHREGLRDAISEDAPPELLAILANPDAGLVRLEPGRGMQDDAHAALSEMLADEEAVLREAVSRGRSVVLEGDIKSRFKALGLRYDPANIEHHRAGLAILRGTLRGVEARRKRLAGEIVPTPAPIAASKGPKLSEVLTLWEAGSRARGGRRRSESSIREARLAVRRFTELHGDLPIGSVTPAMARAFRDALEKIPIRLSEKERALPLKSLLQKDLTDRERTHGATINKQLNLLKAVISQAERNGALDALPTLRNPFKGVSSEVDERQADRREPFSTEDLEAIFTTPIYTAGERPAGGSGEAAFWLPLLALLTGCRLGELAQLRVCDVTQEDGVWHLDVGVSGGRKVKTASSRRKVPLHPTLEAIGFLSYREARLKESGPEADLWPDVRSAPGRDRVASFSQWFGRHLRRVAKVTDPGKVFHSFRHTFKRRARDAGLREELSDALTGHAGGGVGRAYGGGFGLKALAEGIANIEAPAPVMALSWDSEKDCLSQSLAPSSSQRATRRDT